MRFLKPSGHHVHGVWALGPPDFISLLFENLFRLAVIIRGFFAQDQQCGMDHAVGKTYFLKLE